MAFEYGVKDEFKEELCDEVMLSQEEGDHDITVDAHTACQCLCVAVCDLSIQDQCVVSVKAEFSAATSTPKELQYERALPLQKYSCDWLSTNKTAELPSLSHHIKSSVLNKSLKHSISKNGVEWYGKYIGPPRKLVVGWCDSRRAKAILDFLESFAHISQSSKYSRCYNFSIACNGPRVLACKECLSQFWGLHDRYLKLCRHYKSFHNRNCNKLIGQKLSQHHSTLLLMISAWQQDISETVNHVGSNC